MIIESRFNGPDGSANGGYTCGLLSNHLDCDCAEVTLRKPPPLDTSFQLQTENEVLQLLLEEELVASAKPGELDLEIPEFPTWEQTVKASASYHGHTNHPFPHCFVCGPKRETSSGLRIFAGPVEGTQTVAATWVPHPSLGDDNGFVRREFLWCALDCPGAFAVDQKLETPRVLGRLTGQVFFQPKSDEKIRVLGWPLGEERRKAFAGTALMDSEDRICAVAKAVWIALG